MVPFLGPFAFYLGLGGLLTLEEAGVFLLPGDISMIAAGVYAAQGGTFILVSWLVSIAGMVGGSLLLFSIVKRTNMGDRVVPERVRSLVLKHGALGVMVARLLPGLRNATVVAAASANLPLRPFVMGLIPAAALWSGLLLLVGWFGGDAFLSLYSRVHHAPILRALSLVLLMVAASFVIFRLHATRERSPDLSEM